MFKRASRVKSYAPEKKSDTDPSIPPPPLDTPPPPPPSPQPQPVTPLPPKIFRPSYCTVRIQEIRLILQNSTRKVSKGDLLYYEWNIENIKDVSGFVKVRDAKLVKFPKTAKFSFQTLVYSEDKTSPPIKDKFLIIQFRKSESDPNSISDPLIGTLKLDYTSLISDVKEITFKKTRNEKYLIAPPSDTDETYTAKISTRSKLGPFGQTHMEIDSNEFSEASEPESGGENAQASEDENLNDEDVSLEFENLKNKFQELAAKKEHEKREFEKAVKIWIDEKQKLETQLREVLAGKGDSLNLFLMKKIEDLESAQKAEHMFMAKKKRL